MQIQFLNNKPYETPGSKKGFIQGTEQKCQVHKVHAHTHTHT